MADGTIFVVDDDAAVRSSLEMLFGSVGLPVRTFAAAQEFLDSGSADQPGCVVLDVRMPGMSGLELQRHLVSRGVRMPVIVVTGHGDVPIAVRALKDGAVEFLEKPFSKQVLLEHVRDALALDARRRAESSRRATVSERLARLSAREREVMELVVAGKASKEVAIALGISKKTVDAHRASVMRKMEAESLAQLVEAVLLSRGGGTRESA